jgi:hypothetical protein
MTAKVVLATFILVLAGCSGGGETRQVAGDTTAATTRPTAAGSSSTPAASSEEICPLTLPNRSTPPDARDWPADDSYGNGKLWTLFWPLNLVIANDRFVEDDGAIRMKWPWWRGVQGELRIEGRRLDGKAPPLTAEIPPGYGQSGFQPSGIFFPTEGCWEVTGSVGAAKLTFVTVVVKASTYFLEEKKG